MTTPPLDLQTLLRTHGPAAADALAIRSRPHGKYPELVCLKYDQRLSPMHEPAVQQARGIILDTRTWDVVSAGMFKFFNLDEPHAAPLDWSTARIEEKLDGSVLSLYWYDGEWQVQTSGTADAAGNIVMNIRQQGTKTFRELFWETWNLEGYRLPPSPTHEGGRRATYVFELIGPENKIVVNYKAPELILLAVRDLDTMQELDPETVGRLMGYKTVRTFDLTPENIRTAANALPGQEGEGFVVRDAAFRRLKVKGESYLALSLIKESWTPARALGVILAGEADEVRATIPEYGRDLDLLQVTLDQALAEAERLRAQHAHVTDRKAYALLVKDSPYSTALFALQGTPGRTVREWLHSLDRARQLRILDAWRIVDRAMHNNTREIYEPGYLRTACQDRVESLTVATRP